MIAAGGSADTWEGGDNLGRGYSLSVKASSQVGDGDARVLGSAELLPGRRETCPDGGVDTAQQVP